MPLPATLRMPWRAQLARAWAFSAAYVALAAASARSAVWGVLERVPGFPARPPLPGLDALPSARWLAEKLGEPVEEVRAADMGENRGMVGDFCALEARLAGGRSRRLVLKRTRGTAAGRRAALAGARYREAWFTAWPEARRAAAMPEVLHAGGSALLGEAVMLMEDLRARGSVEPTRLAFGDQIFGGGARPEQSGVEEGVRLCFRWAAGLHSAFWRDPALLRRPWLKNAAYYRGGQRGWWELGLASVAGRWRDASPDRRAAAGERLGGLMDRALARTTWRTLQWHLAHRPFTLTHGDFHAANAFHGPAGAVFFDACEAGVWEPCADLAQMIISDVRPAQYRGRTRDWVRAYWQHLTRRDGGIAADEYPWERCWDDFCRAGVERWIWFLAFMSGMPGLPDALFRYFCAQVEAFVDEHLAGREEELHVHSIAVVG